MTRAMCRWLRQFEAVGHAVRAAYTYSGMSAVSAETSGKLDYQSADAVTVGQLVNKKLYITGGIGSGETSEGFGPIYSLRNGAYCESCSNCGDVVLPVHMNLRHPGALKYAYRCMKIRCTTPCWGFRPGGCELTYTNALTGGGDPGALAPGNGAVHRVAHLSVLRGKHSADAAVAAHVDLFHQR